MDMNEGLLQHMHQMTTSQIKFSNFLIIGNPAIMNGITEITDGIINLSKPTSKDTLMNCIAKCFMDPELANDFCHVLRCYSKPHNQVYRSRIMYDYYNDYESDHYYQCEYKILPDSDNVIEFKLFKISRVLPSLSDNNSHEAFIVNEKDMAIHNSVKLLYRCGYKFILNSKSKMKCNYDIIPLDDNYDKSDPTFVDEAIIFFKCMWMLYETEEAKDAYNNDISNEFNDYNQQTSGDDVNDAY